MQWVAMVTMLIDHIGAIWMPDATWMRMIGRIALPIYAYLIVLGYQRTRNYQAYAWRLLVVALAAQLPFMYDFGAMHLNVVFTLLTGLLCIRALDGKGSKWDGVVAMAAVGIVLTVQSDYGMYGVLLVVAYRYLSGVWVVVAHAVLTAVFYVYGDVGALQVFSVLPACWIAYKGKRELPAPPRWMWRSFYPAHLAVLGMIILLQGGNG